MAGRGTDILLGGNPESMAKEEFRKRNLDPDTLQTAAVGTPERTEWDTVLKKYKAETDAEHDEVVSLGGLHVVGTERHESRRIDKEHPSAWDYTGLQSDVLSQFGVKIDPDDLTQLNRAEIEDHIVDLLEARYKEKEDLIGPEIMRDAERMIMLNVIDNQWKDHL